VSGLGRTPTTPENREEVGAPPHWQPIPLRSIGCQCGGPMPRADFYRRIFTLPKIETLGNGEMGKSNSKEKRNFEDAKLILSEKFSDEINGRRLY
jgi:hypothetical protein